MTRNILCVVAREALLIAACSMTQHADLPRVIDTGNFFDARASEV